jgi:hypothetical protein
VISRTASLAHRRAADWHPMIRSGIPAHAAVKVTRLYNDGCLPSPFSFSKKLLEPLVEILGSWHECN